MCPTTTPKESKRSEPRERLLSTAAGIFYADGIRTVGIDRIIAEAGVTKATFYRHFPSKEDLVLAYLRKEDTAIRHHLEPLSTSLEPLDVLRAVGSGTADELCRPGFRGCAFINAATEYPDPASPVRLLVDEHRAWFHQFVVDALSRAGHYDPKGGADHFALMRDGAMIQGHLSDPSAAAAVFCDGIEGVIRVMQAGGLHGPDAHGRNVRSTTTGE